MTQAHPRPTRDTSPHGSLAAVRQAVRAAVVEHRRRGEAVVVRQDGHFTWVAAEDIVLPGEDEPAS